MLENIAIIILFGSIFGMGIILFRKIPALTKLPVKAGETNNPFFYNLTNNIRLLGSVKRISLKNILLRVFSWIKNLILKTKNKKHSLLERSKRKARKKKGIESDTYWQDLKKKTNQKK